MTIQPQAIYDTLKEARLTVIVPVFNEADRIVENLELLIAEIEPFFLSYEILVISDGSTDGTNELLKQFRHDRVKTIVHERNAGKGFVIRSGFKAAHGDYVLFIDGGMELHPMEIRIFLGLMALYSADFVIGSKRHPQSKVSYPLMRRVLSFTYQLLVRQLFDLDVTDTQVGLKLLRREVVEAILPDLRIDRYGFDLELLALAKLHGYDRVLEAPIRLDYFSKNIRSPLLDLFHVANVGRSVLYDTFRLYHRIARLKKNRSR